MSIKVTCSSCQTSLAVGESAAGKRVKCPGCGQPVAVPGAAVAVAARPMAAVGAGGPSPAAAAPAPVDIITCPGCSARFRAKPEWAGKTLKCAKCAGPIRVPAAHAEVEDDWINITEPYVRPGEKARSAAARSSPATEGAAATGWGEEVLEDQELPDEMREQIHQALTKGERLTWAGRPLVDVLMHRARKQRMVGILLICGFTIGVPVIDYFIFTRGPAGMIVVGCFLLFFMLVFDAVGVFLTMAPGRTRRSAGKRPCYMVTNRRLVIHPGMGAQMATSRGGSSTTVTLGADGQGVTSYNGMELLALRRDEDKAFPGTGELLLGRNLLDEPAGGALVAMGDLVGLEKRIREELIHPVIDKLLRGELSVKTELGRKKERPSVDEGEALPTDGNLKDFAGDDLPTEGNVKAASSPLEGSLKGVSKECRQKVEEELTEGERILWIGKPEGSTQSRGILGAAMGAATRVEPDYILYALTNRRVILWDKKGTRDARFSFGNVARGPISYYPPQMLDAFPEDDKRIPNGGSIIFKRIKRVIIKQDKQGKQTRKTEIHHFGVLRIRNYAVVARVLFNTLIRPCDRR